jgi:hypothetical protein
MMSPWAWPCSFALARQLGQPLVAIVKLSCFAKTLMCHVHSISLCHGMCLVVELPFEVLHCIVYCVAY